MGTIKTAILLTGASARISQEVAILEQLINQKNLDISPSNSLLAGFSSGCLNLVAINKLLNTPQWDSYYKSQILFPLKTTDIYTCHGMIPFSTHPLRNKVETFLSLLDIKDMKDLPYHSSILAYQRRLLFPRTRWANSSNSRHHYLKLADLMMASTAIPVVFPHQHVYCESNHWSTFPTGRWRRYADGGTGGTFDRFGKFLGSYVKKHGMFEDMYIISPMRECETHEYDGEVEDLSRVVCRNVHDDIQRFLGAVIQRSFIKFLRKLESWTYKGKPMAKNIYVCIPELQKNFPLMFFDEQFQQYQAVNSWIDVNPDKLARPIAEYLR